MALEQEQVGAAFQRGSRPSGRKPGGRAPAVVQAAAVGRVDAHGARFSGQPRIGATLGAVAVHHVRPRVPPRAPDMADAARSPAPMSRLIGMRVRPSASPPIGESRVGLCAAARRIGDHADPVSARRLAACEVADMAEQSADRGAQHVQDVEGSAGGRVYPLLTRRRRVDGQRPIR